MVLDLEEEDTRRLKHHKAIYDKRIAVALPILIVAAIMVLAALIALVVQIVRAS
jgi:hypothetical protein